MTITLFALIKCCLAWGAKEPPCRLEPCPWSHWQQQRCLVWGGLRINTPHFLVLLLSTPLWSSKVYWGEYSHVGDILIFPTAWKRTRERWKGKIHYVGAFLTAWGKETWILPFFSFSSEFILTFWERKMPWMEWFAGRDFAAVAHSTRCQWLTICIKQKEKCDGAECIFGSKTMYTYKFILYREIMSYISLSTVWYQYV